MAVLHVPIFTLVLIFSITALVISDILVSRGFEDYPVFILSTPSTILTLTRSGFGLEWFVPTKNHRATLRCFVHHLYMSFVEPLRHLSERFKLTLLFSSPREISVYFIAWVMFSGIHNRLFSIPIHLIALFIAFGLFLGGSASLLVLFTNNTCGVLTYRDFSNCSLVRDLLAISWVTMWVHSWAAELSMSADHWKWIKCVDFHSVFSRGGNRFRWSKHRWGEHTAYANYDRIPRTCHLNPCVVVSLLLFVTRALFFPGAKQSVLLCRLYLNESLEAYPVKLVFPWVSESPQYLLFFLPSLG